MPAVAHLPVDDDFRPAVFVVVDVLAGVALDPKTHIRGPLGLSPVRDRARAATGLCGVRGA
jgi:hypothetical protein